MRFAIVSRHVPDPEGTAAGRVLLATCEGLIADGHEIRVSSWGTEPPRVELPAWCDWRSVRAPRGLSRLRTYLEPVTEVRQIGWVPPDDPTIVAVADDPPSWPAVAAARRGVVTLHYLSAFDLRALGKRTFKGFQESRAERRAARRAPLVLAYSDRVATAAGRDAVSIPVAYPVPHVALERLEEPVAAALADWSWPPNAVALRWLFEMWPTVRERVNGARLLLGGRGLPDVPRTEGIEVARDPRQSVDVLSRAALVAFPSPATSGPKIKILEALAHGLPVVTSRAGVEGLRLGPGEGAVIASRSAFAKAVASLLSDPEERARLGSTGRAAVTRSHAPLAAARERVRVIRRAFDGTAPGVIQPPG